MSRLIISVILIIFQLLSAQVSQKAPYPTKEWKKQTPADQHLDSKILNDLVNEIRFGGYQDIHSVLIIKNGYLVLEEYFQDYHRDKIHTLQSVSKSFASALIGIAIEKYASPSCSYDFALLNMPKWTENNQKEMDRIQQETGILVNPIVGYSHEDEYPKSVKD